MSVLGTAAAVATAFFTAGNPAAIMAAYSLGSGVDAYINAPDQMGPRLDDLRTQMSTYGAPIPFEWGINRHAGTIIWPAILEAVEHEHSESAKGGPEIVSFTYTMSFAVLLCEGPIAGVRRIWANKRLVYDITEGNEGATQDPALGTMRVYLGTEDQIADPLIEALDGPSPAYRGYAYVVFEDYDVTEMQGRPPQFEFEVITEGEAIPIAPESLGDGGGSTVYETGAGVKQIWTVDETGLFIYDVESGDLVDTVTLPADATSITVHAGSVWVGHSNTSSSPYPYAASKINGVTHAIDEATMFGYGGSTPLGTLVSSGGSLFGFANNGLGAGARRYPDNVSSGVTVPSLVFHSQEMPDRALFAVAGYGNWMAIASGPLDYTVATLTNADWPTTSVRHRFAYNTDRDSLFWAAPGEDNVYKIDLDTNTLSLFITIADVHGITYHAGTDLLYVDVGTALYAYSPATGSLISAHAAAGVLTSTILGNSVDTGSNRFYFVSQTGGLWKIPVSGSLTGDQIPLSTIVSDICLRAGLEVGDIDVTELTDSVDGYIIGRQMTARSAIEPLQTAFFFDAVEREDKIAFVKRDGVTVTTIPIDDRAARESGQDSPDALSIMREFELELPYQCEVEYPDVDADHLIGTQYDRRITTQSRQKLTIALPIVMTAEQAKKIARTALYEAWQKQGFQWTTSRKYAHLEPTDIVSLATAAASYQARITNKREQPNGVIEWEGRLTSLEVYDQTGADAAPTSYVVQTIYDPGDTILELLDIPMLRDDDDNAGFYVAMAGTLPGWRGAQLFRSSDGGGNYDDLMAFTTEATIGAATDVLGDFTAGNIFDEGSTVTVVMRSGIALTSVTEDQVLNGSNKAAIGASGRWEIIHFKTATLVAADTYELSGFLRGCRGTEWATGTHLTGDTFVLASVASWNRLNAGDTGLERLYKAPPVRVRLDDVDSEAFTNTSIGLKPFSPVDAVGTRDGSNNLTGTFSRRTRLAAGTLHLPVLLGEATEAYEIDILDGVDVVRTITTSTQSFGYTAAEQTADGLTPGDLVDILVYQMSASVGRGYPLEATI